MIEFTIPIRTYSLANQHEHWRVRHRRAKRERGLAKVLTRNALGRHPVGFPLRVTLTRCAPRALDDDNLTGAGKSLRDGIADALGIDDRDPAVQWAYRQKTGRGVAYAVEVQIESTRTEDQ